MDFEVRELLRSVAGAKRKSDGLSDPIQHQPPSQWMETPSEPTPPTAVCREDGARAEREARGRTSRKTFAAEVTSAPVWRASRR
jgi:hypothetical protein